MKKLILINCYFGNLPQYFNFYMESVRYNSTVDFLLVTDDKTPRDYPQNLIVKYLTFAQLQEKMQTLFDFKIELSTHYKLCDYKPVFGKLFYEDIKNYDFWGYADIDLIYGDIRRFVTEEILTSYDKIQTAGHFTLMPVNEEHVNFYTNELPGISYKNAFTSPLNLAFDEWPGMTTIYNNLGKKIYNSVNDFADLAYYVWYFLPSEEVYRRNGNDKIWHTHNIAYLFDNGKLFKVGLNSNNEVTYTESMYVHFQKRKVTAFGEVKNKFLILPPGKIVTEFDEITPKFLKKYAKEKKLYFAFFKMRVKNLLKKLKGKK